VRSVFDAAQNLVDAVPVLAVASPRVGVLQCDAFRMITSASASTTTAGELLGAADTAMYTAKDTHSVVPVLSAAWASPAA
jgi:hypothetical protein